ncbi:rod shape-determining protein MreC [Dialister sp.]|uniref:rod shape-determining protein MreC n=1 Tax=Dialister sp. TaxID=1955814 RepID=UPI0025D6C729|nr:rod shape-determining protein MreC [Dialister sp.]
MIFFGKKKIASIIVLFAFMGACGWFWRHREYIPFVSQPLSVGAAPFEYGVSRAAWFGENSIGMVQQIFTNWKDLEELKRENESLKAEQNRYSEVLAENIRLRNLLKFKQGYTSYNMVGASVIERDYGGWTHTMVIDRGEDSGIKKYMPVIIPSGLVGFVSEVYMNSSRVQLLLDPRTTVGGIVQRPASRVVSMVSGNSGNPGLLSFMSLPKESDVIKGDIIVTSGYGGVYPKGLVIGTVEQVDVDSEGGTQSAEIRPAADFAHMEEVFIITDHIQKTSPDSITVKPPKIEPPMNPNKQQAGDK